MAININQGETYGAAASSSAAAAGGGSGSGCNHNSAGSGQQQHEPLRRDGQTERQQYRGTYAPPAAQRSPGNDARRVAEAHAARATASASASGRSSLPAAGPGTSDPRIRTSLPSQDQAARSSVSQSADPRRAPASRRNGPSPCPDLPANNDRTDGRAASLPLRESQSGHARQEAFSTQNLRASLPASGAGSNRQSGATFGGHRQSHSQSQQPAYQQAHSRGILKPQHESDTAATLRDSRNGRAPVNLAAQAAAQERLAYQKVTHNGQPRPIRPYSKTLTALRNGDIESAFEPKESTHLLPEELGSRPKPQSRPAHLTVYFPPRAPMHSVHEPKECFYLCNGQPHPNSTPVCRFCKNAIGPHFRDNVSDNATYSGMSLHSKLTHAAHQVYTHDMALEHLIHHCKLPAEERTLLLDGFREFDKDCLQLTSGTRANPERGYVAPLKQRTQQSAPTGPSLSSSTSRSHAIPAKRFVPRPSVSTVVPETEAQKLLKKREERERLEEAARARQEYEELDGLVQSRRGVDMEGGHAEQESHRHASSSKGSRTAVHPQSKTRREDSAAAPAVTRGVEEDTSADFNTIDDTSMESGGAWGIAPGDTSHDRESSAGAEIDELASDDEDDGFTCIRLQSVVQQPPNDATAAPPCLESASASAPAHAQNATLSAPRTSAADPPRLDQRVAAPMHEQGPPTGPLQSISEKGEPLAPASASSPNAKLQTKVRDTSTDSDDSFEEDDEFLRPPPPLPGLSRAPNPYSMSSRKSGDPIDARKNNRLFEENTALFDPAPSGARSAAASPAKAPSAVGTGTGPSEAFADLLESVKKAAPGGRVVDTMRPQDHTSFFDNLFRPPPIQSVSPVRLEPNAAPSSSRPSFVPPRPAGAQRRSTASTAAPPRQPSIAPTPTVAPSSVPVEPPRALFAPPSPPPTDPPSKVEADSSLDFSTAADKAEKPRKASRTSRSRSPSVEVLLVDSQPDATVSRKEPEIRAQATQPALPDVIPPTPFDLPTIPAYQAMVEEGSDDDDIASRPRSRSRSGSLSSDDGDIPPDELFSDACSFTSDARRSAMTGSRASSRPASQAGTGTGTTRRKVDREPSSDPVKMELKVEPAAKVEPKPVGAPDAAGARGYAAKGKDRMAEVVTVEDSEPELALLQSADLPSGSLASEPSEASESEEDEPVVPKPAEKTEPAPALIRPMARRQGKRVTPPPSKAATSERQGVETDFVGGQVHDEVSEDEQKQEEEQDEEDSSSDPDAVYVTASWSKSKYQDKHGKTPSKVMSSPTSASRATRSSSAKQRRRDRKPVKSDSDDDEVDLSELEAKIVNKRQKPHMNVSPAGKVPTPARVSHSSSRESSDSDKPLRKKSQPAKASASQNRPRASSSQAKAKKSTRGPKLVKGLTPSPPAPGGRRRARRDDEYAGTSSSFDTESGDEVESISDSDVDDKSIVPIVSDNSCESSGLDTEEEEAERRKLYTRKHIRIGEASPGGKKRKRILESDSEGGYGDASKLKSESKSREQTAGTKKRKLVTADVWEASQREQAGRESDNPKAKSKKRKKNSEGRKRAKVKAAREVAREAAFSGQPSTPEAVRDTQATHSSSRHKRAAKQESISAPNSVATTKGSTSRARAQASLDSNATSWGASQSAALDSLFSPGVELMDHASTEEDDDFPPVLKEYAAMLKANDILNMFDLRRSVRDGADSEVTNFANYLAVSADSCGALTCGTRN